MIPEPTKMAIKMLAGNIRKGPRYLVLFITGRCNCRCPMCFNWQNVLKRKDDNELTLGEIGKIAESIGFLPQLLISGGEPFIRKDISQIVKIFYEKAGTRQISIPTNATLTQDILSSCEEILLSCGEAFLNINLSLDGIGEVHDISRGHKGGFKKLEATYYALEKLREKNKRLTINFLTTVKKSNLDKLDEINEYVKKNFKPNYHYFGLIRGDVCSPDEKAYDVEYAHKTIDRFSRHGQNFKDFPLFPKAAGSISNLTNSLILEMRKNKTRGFECLAGEKIIVITQEGLLMPCEPLWLEPETRNDESIEPFIMADLRDYGFDISLALKSTKAKKVLEFIKKRKCFCEYGCAIINSIIYSPKMYPRLIKEIFK